MGGTSALTSRVAQKGCRFAAAFTALLLLVALPAFGFAGQRTDGSPKSPAAPTVPAKPARPMSRLSGVTIEATRDRQALRRRVNTFVNSVLVRHLDETMLRWDVPICPLVAGLPKESSEFVFKRISQVASGAHIKLAGKMCQPNLIVVVTADPEQVLHKWWDRDKTLYDTGGGIDPVLRFIDSKRPIRVWYNKERHCKVGPGATSSATVGDFEGHSLTTFIGLDCSDTLLEYGILQGIMSAIVVVDWRRVKNVTFVQMVDYVALVSLADLRPDADPGTTPSILELFGHEKPPQQMTEWDRALLYALYDTRQASKLQVQAMEGHMTNRLAR